MTISKEPEWHKKKYYTMKECFDECGDDDVPYIQGFIEPLRTKAEWIEKSMNFDQIKIDYALTDKWQIKRAEPEVVESDWYWREKVPIINNHTTNILECRKQDIIDAFKFADQNGQNREWLRPEQVELREAVSQYITIEIEKYYDEVDHTRLINAFENLKPPNKGKND